MFTNEHEWDHSKTTLMDTQGVLDDIVLISTDKNIIMRQWNELLNDYDHIIFTHDMWNMLMVSQNKPEGFFK
jgi:peroxiredoxin